MSELATIRPDGARVLVAQPSTATRPVRLVDRTDPEGGAQVHTDATSLFVVVDPDAPSPASPAGDGLGQVALVPSAGAAAGLRVGGWAGLVVVEVVLDERAKERLAALRDTGELVGVIVGPGSPIDRSFSTGDGAPEVGPVASADPWADAALGRERGRTVGLLTEALLSGVATVRTDDPVTARRVRAVVATLTDPGDGDARMDP